MTSPLSGSLAKTVGSAFNSLFLDAVLARDVKQIGSNPIDPSPPVVTTFNCKAIVEAYSDKFRSEGLVEQNDRKVLILATSLATRPLAKDRVTIRGITFQVIDVSTDPAEAVWSVQGRM